MFTVIARSLCNIPDNIATPCSVKAQGKYLRPPQLEVTNCDLKKRRPLPQGSALNLFQAPPRSAAMRNSCPRGHSFRFRMLVPQSSNDGNELDTTWAGTGRAGSGSARRSGTGLHLVACGIVWDNHEALDTCIGIRPAIDVRAILPNLSRSFGAPGFPP